MAPRSDGLVDQLVADRRSFDRSSTAEWIADVLRRRITEGAFPPGTRLPEEQLGRALAVSRNSLREAFRLLAHERLLTYQLNKGVYVRDLTADDVRDLYLTRRLLECGAIRAADRSRPGWLAEVTAAVAEADAAVAADDWGAVGTANMRFHQALAGLAGSTRVADTMRLILAELRLTFQVVAQPRDFHEPYLEANREIHRLLATGRLGEAERLLDDYLTRAERELIEAFADADGAVAAR